MPVRLLSNKSLVYLTPLYRLLKNSLVLRWRKIWSAAAATPLWIL
jgi:hypothetical protein